MPRYRQVVVRISSVNRGSSDSSQTSTPDGQPYDMPTLEAHVSPYAHSPSLSQSPWPAKRHV